MRPFQSRRLRPREVYYQAALRSLFFFQAEDGIRDVAVTGVQTCALPIFFRTTPLVNNQKRAPGVALWTSGTRRLGAFGEPSAELPWHSAQCCSNRMAPAATASGSFSRGFRRFRAFSGAFCNSA